MGLYARAYEYKEWQKVQDDWGEALSKADIKINVKVKVKSMGPDQMKKYANSCPPLLFLYTACFCCSNFFVNLINGYAPQFSEFSCDSNNFIRAAGLRRV